MVKESKQASKQTKRENSNRRQTFFIPIRDIHSQPKQKKWDSRKRLNDQKNEVQM